MMLSGGTVVVCGWLEDMILTLNENLLVKLML